MLLLAAALGSKASLLRTIINNNQNIIKLIYFQSIIESIHFARHRMPPILVGRSVHPGWSAMTEACGAVGGGSGGGNTSGE